MKIAQASRYWETMRLMAPAQVLHRVRLRGQRSLYRRFPSQASQRWATGVRATGRWPTHVRPIDRSVAHEPIVETDTGGWIYRNLGEHVDVSADGWRPTDRTQLFRYHLHYFEWAWPMAASGTDVDRRLFAELWRSWQADTVPGRWDEWSPYVVSLRAWVLCGAFDDLIRGSSVETEVIEHQRMALGFLHRNLELDVGGNHLIKNLKALIGLAVFFDDRKRLTRGLERLAEELDRQILADGGHYELSPSYHAQVMADLIDVTGLCDAAGVPTPFDGDALIRRMGDWLAAMSYPDGTLPLLGDCTPPPDGLLAAVRATGTTETGPLTVLADSGYVSARVGDSMLVVDFGPPCPPELPAHAQADWGTFELWTDGARVICDPGVSTYVGPERARERSTAAHNTVTVAGQNQTDVWSSFRAGKRATPSPITVVEEGNRTVIESSLVDIHGIRHHRRFELTDSELRIEDTIESGTEPATSNLTLAPGLDHTAIEAANTTAMCETTIAAGFGIVTPARRLEQTVVDGRAGWVIPLHPLRIDREVGSD